MELDPRIANSLLQGAYSSERGRVRNTSPTNPPSEVCHQPAQLVRWFLENRADSVYFRVIKEADQGNPPGVLASCLRGYTFEGIVGAAYPRRVYEATFGEQVVLPATIAFSLLKRYIAEATAKALARSGSYRNAARILGKAQRTQKREDSEKGYKPDGIRLGRKVISTVEITSAPTQLYVARKLRQFTDKQREFPGFLNGAHVEFVFPEGSRVPDMGWERPSLFEFIPFMGLSRVQLFRISQQVYEEYSPRRGHHATLAERFPRMARFVDLSGATPKHYLLAPKAVLATGS